MYSLGFETHAYRIFKKLDAHSKEEITRQAERLCENPFLGNPLQGRFRRYRSLHFSLKGVAYRIIYVVIPEQKHIIIQLADKRENIYKRLEEMNA